MDEAVTARSRGALSRVQTLRMERRTRDAQTLASAVATGQLSGITFGRVTERDTVAAVLGEDAALERALLLLRQDDAARYAEALDVLATMRDRLLPPDGSPQLRVLSGHRHTGMVAKLSVAYSQAGRESESNELAARILHLESTRFETWHAWQTADWRRQVASASTTSAADHLGNISARASRLALIDILAGTPACRRRANRWLDIAERTAGISLEKHGTAHGRAVGQGALLAVELHRAQLEESTGLRHALLHHLARRVWDFVVESHRMPANGRAVLMRRHAFYGQVLLELGQCLDSDLAFRPVRLARVAIRPLAATHERDASYDSLTGLFYGDACAMSGDLLRAMRAWQRSLSRLSRARPDRADAAAAIRRRLDRGASALASN